MADYLLLYSITRTLKDGTKENQNCYDWFRFKEELADAILDQRSISYEGYKFEIQEILEINSYDNLDEKDVIEECADELKKIYLEEGEGDEDWEKFLAEIYPKKEDNTGGNTQDD